eukprot:s443_g32.t1
MTFLYIEMGASRASRSSGASGASRSDAGEEEEDLVYADTNPLVAKMAGKWETNYDGWGNPSTFHPVEISCDGKWKRSRLESYKPIWSGKITHIDTGEKMKEKCTKGTKKAQFYLPNWNEEPKWECGWYDEATDQIHVYHYWTAVQHTGHGHKAGDSYWGMMQKSKRINKENCPTPAPKEEEKSNAMVAGASLLLWNVMSLYLWER